MTFKEKLQFFYGFMMGTSVRYVKKTKRHLWPSQFGEVGGITLQVGGSHNCGILLNGADILLIDTGSGAASLGLQKWLATHHPEKKVRFIINTHPHVDSAEGNAGFTSVETIWQPLSQTSTLKSAVQIVDRDIEIEFGEQRLQLIYLKNTASFGDLVVNLPSHKIAFLGELFFNRIHPILRDAETVDPEAWALALESLLEKLQAKSWIPAEGVPGSGADVLGFISYLRDLRDPQIEFGECRERYDWTEIPAFTSLEENFDLLRLNKKTHIKMNLPDLPFSR